MATVKTHEGAHKYMRLKTRGGSYIYRCMEADCSHYLAIPERIINRKAKCWYCPNEFIVTRELARRKRVHCENCTEKKIRINLGEVTSFLEEIKEDNK